MFVSLWGLMQFVCFFAGVPYPSLLFNNSLSDFADMFDQRLDDAYMRIASVAVEPSVLATSLLHFVAFGLTGPRLRAPPQKMALARAGWTVARGARAVQLDHGLCRSPRAGPATTDRASADMPHGRAARGGADHSGHRCGPQIARCRLGNDGG